jgi:hypothetical protein
VIGCTVFYEPELGEAAPPEAVANSNGPTNGNSVPVTLSDCVPVIWNEKIGVNSRVVVRTGRIHATGQPLRLPQS